MYTNGFKLTEVLSALTGRIGWRQGASTGEPTLTAVNTGSTSGRYFNDFHSLVSIRNLRDVVEGATISDSDFNQVLTNKSKAAILKVLTSVFETPDIHEQNLLFDRLGYRDQLEPNNGHFVGYRIRPAADPAVAIQVHSATLLMNGAATFNLYLFHDASAEPLETISVTVAEGEQQTVDLSDWYLSYLTGTSRGGNYYIGYFQDDLGSVQAYNESVRCWNPSFTYAYMPVALTAPDTERIDTDPHTSGGSTYGLNLHVTSFKDNTQRIIRSKSLFDNAIGLQMTVDVLESIVYSTGRSSANERDLKEVIAEAAFDLNGTIPVAGVAKRRSKRDELGDAIQNLKRTFNPSPRAQNINLC